MKDNYCSHCGTKMNVSVTKVRMGYYKDSGNPWDVWEGKCRCPNLSWKSWFHDEYVEYGEVKLNEQ